MEKGKSTYFGFFSTDISAKQNTDTGMAMVLILLLVGFFTGQMLFYKLAIPVLLINMVYPKIFYPIAVFWLGLSALLGTVMSAIILSVVFAVLVIPIGLFRRLIGKDAMQLKKFNETSDSVFSIRNHTYTAQDLENPF
ncbi:MAG TPA: SxtJ family membrane protein [Balneolaceae bacterium]